MTANNNLSTTDSYDEDCILHPNLSWCSDDANPILLSPSSPSLPPAIYHDLKNDTTYYPTFSPSSNSAARSDHEYELEVTSSTILVTVLCLFAAVITAVVFCAFESYNRVVQEQRSSTTAQPPTTETQNQVPTNTSAAGIIEEQSEKCAAAKLMLHTKVLGALFPEEEMDSSNNKNLPYDLEVGSCQESDETPNKGNAICPICIEKVKDGDSVVAIRRCKHTFHRHCILGWCQIRMDCPVCRQDMWDPMKCSLVEKDIAATKAAETEYDG